MTELITNQIHASQIIVYQNTVSLTLWPLLYDIIVNLNIKKCKI